LAAAAGVELRGLLTAAELTFATIASAARGARLLVLPQGNAPGAAELLSALVAGTPLPLLVLGPRDE
jgi:hypothetical protein